MLHGECYFVELWVCFFGILFSIFESFCNHFVIKMLVHMINNFFEKISFLYMNRVESYSGEYYYANHLKRYHWVSWYVMRWWYAYFIKHWFLPYSKLQVWSKVLDIWCGIWVWVQQRKKLWYDAYGYDVEEPAILSNIEKERCRLVEGDMLPYEDDVFDLVVSREVLEHIPSESIHQWMEEWERVGTWTMIHMIAVTERWVSAIDDPMHCNVQSISYWIDLFNTHWYDCHHVSDSNLITPFGNKWLFVCEKRALS